MSDSFHRLAPFIQEYIYNEGWTELRPIQREACRVLFETEAHLLVAAGTASGKTEAAFLPILTLLYEDPPKTVGAIYIGPIKALINDQCDRLTDLLKFTDIPVWAWHGDVGQGVKRRLLKQPRGILQITPESLESLLINKYTEIPRLFGDLRFVVIDEIHAFIGSDRGAQILCQLARLAQITGKVPRRVGLSATLGDYALAEAWLQAGTPHPVITPTVASSKRTIHLALEHFYDAGVSGRAVGETRDTAFSPCYWHLFQQSLNRKCLIFANGRMETEAVITQLRRIAQAKGTPDIYHVHHGSISAELRQAAEAAMRDPTSATVTAATVTFEMGIDLGKLDRVIQLEAPPSVSSFLQRLGRSGRRGSPADMRFVCIEDQPNGSETLPQLLPWQLLQCIAVIQLYLEEQWIEPLAPPIYPFSLLYHQTLSTLAAMGELSPPQLAQHILTLPPLRSIALEDFRLLLQHLIGLDHIQRTSEGGLILGLAGEKLVRNFKFYAIFPDNEEFAVWAEGSEVGTIVVVPQVGDKVALAGRTWEVVEVDSRRKVVQVRLSLGAATVSWRGSGGMIHTRILQRMRQALLEDTLYPYLQSGARARLVAARQLAQKEGIAQRLLFSVDEGYACILPWVGSATYRTLERFLRLHCREALGIKGVSGCSPYYLVVNLGKATLEQLDWELRSVGDRRLHPEALLAEEEAPKLQKYDEYIPPELLRKAFVSDYLNLTELAQLGKGGV